MTTFPAIIEEAERLVRRLAADLTRIRDGECLCCYVARQLEEYPCDNTHRHSLRYRDAVAPRATALLDLLGRMGACCCDCEVLMNAYEPHRRFWTPEREDEPDGLVEIIESDWPEVLPTCAGVRRGTIHPCSNWIRHRRWCVRRTYVRP
ncbi:MAG TPA: DUF2695 domain-containing protein [Jatrophihabitans sp.]|jgi:hypothetical protein|uniref:DUF2695 domain-containing protein n=1 Tax=Jatrophihabitans sp. TaxID=1932789 RepID=UPI002DF9EFC1|nr:DUF2695 domain-containing protein [Jatrophihabitans sp.]